MIEIEDFSFYYPQNDVPALDQLTLKIPNGTFNVVIGESGSGKTTLLRQFKQRLRPAGVQIGTIKLDGQTLAELPEISEAAKIGFVAQRADEQLVSDKVWHELAFGLENLGMPQEVIYQRIAEMSTFFGIESWFERDTDALSGGQKQILNLASVLAMHPALILLDEPAAQLDPLAAADFFQLLRRINQELGITILLAEHRLEEVLPLADQLLILERGKQIFCAPPQQLTPQFYREYPALFHYLPAAAQLALKTRDESNENAALPLTIRDGRTYLQSFGCPRAAAPAENQAAPRLQKAVILSAEHLWFRYEKAEQAVLSDLSLKVPENEILALAGGNGSGKSTLLTLLSGLRPPLRGTLKLAGKKIGKYPPAVLAEQWIGYLPQDPQLVMTEEAVAADLKLVSKSQTAFMRAAAAFSLTPLLERHPFDLSGGELQLAALAKVCLTEPKILLLDEPTNGIDPAKRQALGEIFLQLKKGGTTIIFATHDLEFAAQFADECALLFNGRIVMQKAVNEFLRTNYFYTTAANRIARDYFPQAVTIKEVVQCLKTHLRQKNPAQPD
ncbi:MAG: ATP-binding cassette domain-containing protein [Enterococcaceae bacterium]|jgi:energy-coupling factor transport system ATP-binding protein|nr:ATP-binding cassette domain-containing protein [Enterococcaceae bacterium]MCI1919264.1 ATP-binding cassette domain-containing protein [Enterococcaceae bacterium]